MHHSSSPEKKQKIALISTLYTQAHGGVYTKLRFLVQLLQSMNYQVLLAYYMPYSVSPTLSVPIKKMWRKKPGVNCFVGELGIKEYAMGAVLPELEFANYYPHSHWKSLIEVASLHFVVTGHILSALPFYLTRKKYMVWMAASYSDDRKDRVKLFPWYRKLIDIFFIAKVARWLEKKMLRAGKIFTVSCYAKKTFKNDGQWIQDVIPVPINTDLFFPDTEKTQPGLICFTARFLDPRKNIDFLLEVFAALREKISYAKLCLLGDEITPALTKKLTSLKIESFVEIKNYVSRAELIATLQKTDVFVIPSYQEGLCISGLEAMACGCPVVSTQCGGPSDYVIDGENGYLVDFDVTACVNNLVKIIEDRSLRNKMSARSIEIIQKDYSIDSIQKKWVQHINQFEVENKLCQ